MKDKHVLQDNLSWWRRLRYWWYHRAAVLVKFTVINDSTAEIACCGPGMMKLEIYTRTGKITTLPCALPGDVVNLTFGVKDKPEMEKCVGETFAYRSDWTEQ